MSTFLKDNLVLVIGISLPVLVVALFLLARYVPKTLSAPPAHDFIFTTNEYDYNNQLPVRVNVGIYKKRLRMTLYQTGDNHSYYSPKLFIYDHLTEKVRELEYNLPEDLKSVTDGHQIEIADATKWVISTSKTAPDGYEFKHRSGGGLIRGIFGSSRNRQVLSKNGSVYEIPDTNDDYYNNINFLGWVVGEDQ